MVAGLPHDEGWTFLETVEVPPDSSSRAVARALMQRHPELREDQIRMDLQCGRDGRAWLAFWARGYDQP